MNANNAREILRVLIKNKDEKVLMALALLLEKASSDILTLGLAAEFEELEKSGLGVIVHGRGDKPTRFMWNYSLKS